MRRKPRKPPKCKVKYDYHHVGSIVDDEKWVTARVGWNKPLSPGDRFILTTPDAESFGTAYVDQIQDMSLFTFYSLLEDGVIEGHQKYDDVKLCVEVFRKYYPDKTVNENTVLTVLWHENFTPNYEHGYFARGEGYD